MSVTMAQATNDDTRYLVARFKIALTDKDFTPCFESSSDKEFADKAIVHHCWGYQASAKKNDKVYVLHCPAYTIDSDRIEIKNKKTEETKFIRSYQRYPHPESEWEDTGKIETDTYQFEETWLLLWRNYVISLNTKAAKKFLTCERDANGAAVCDTTGAAKKAHECYMHEMSR